MRGTGCALGLLLLALQAQGGEPEERWALPAGSERAVLALLAPYSLGVPLPGGFMLTDTRISAEAIRARFAAEERSFVLALTRAEPGAEGETSRHFRVALEEAGPDLEPGERARLLALLLSTVQRNDQGPEPWRRVSPKSLEERAVLALPGVDPTDPARAVRRGLQALLLLGLLALVARPGALLKLGRRVPTAHWACLGALTALGAGLRLWGGPRVPGWINGHGLHLVADALAPMPSRIDPHGLGYQAFYELVFLVLPRSEVSLLGCQLALSLACIPLVYLLARLLLHDARAGLWAAGLSAPWPTLVFFGLSEVHQVPGVFFLLLALAACGLAARDWHPAWLAAAALLLACATQFYPTLMLAPALAGLLLWSARGLVDLVRRPAFWGAAGTLALLLAAPVFFLVHRLMFVEDILGQGFLDVLSNLPGLLMPSGSFDARTYANVLLNPCFTPPPFALLTLAGLALGLRRPTLWRPVLALLACGLLCTWVGLVGGRINPARVQLPAAPFYALLAGLGLARLQELVPARWRKLAPLLGAALLGASLLGWPGLLGQRFTPQLERAAFRTALPRVPEGCTVLWPPVRPHLRGLVPLYLDGGRRTWLEADGAPGALPTPDCLWYFRPAACFDRADAQGRGALATDEAGLVPACARAEAGLALEPVHVVRLPASPDNSQVYSRPELEVGFFRARAAR